jgi:hypothetical protein
MLKDFIFIVPIILFLSCGTSALELENKESDQILSQENFTNLMVEIQLLEGHLNVNRVDQVFVMDSSKNYYKEIFKSNGISYEDYKENLKYYTARPALLEEVYTKVEEKLVLKERLYANVLIDQPAISPINRNQLIKILVEDLAIVNLVMDTVMTYSAIKDSVFAYYSDSILKDRNVNSLSFQQSFNVMTHTVPMFRVFKSELKNKLEKIKED